MVASRFFDFKPRILEPADAVQFLLNRDRSPVFSLDTEFTGVPCKATLNGISLAGGTPETFFGGCFWPFGGAHEIVPWAWLREKLLLPLLADPKRKGVLHPWKVDSQLLHARGIPESVIKCQKADTMCMAHVADENLPKGLKELAWCLLAVPEVTSYAQTQKEMKALIKAGDKACKDILRSVWGAYSATQKNRREALKVLKSKALLAGEDRKTINRISVDDFELLEAGWSKWQREAAALPPKMKKEHVLASFIDRIREAVGSDYVKRARSRFAKYGAEDALFTIGVFYALDRMIPENLRPHLAEETEVAHPIVTEMEERGLKIDIDRLSSINDIMGGAIDRLRAKVISEWNIKPEDVKVGKDGEWNPGSADQIAQILWIKWRLRPPPWTQRDGELKPKYRRSKDGLCSTDKNIVRYLSKHAPPPYNTRLSDLQELRRLVKLKGKDVEGMLAIAGPDPEHRCHASFWSVGARTGRFTSDEPNVENVPRPTTMPLVPIPKDADPTKPPKGVDVIKDKKTGQIIWRIGSLRLCFIAPKRWKIISADLSQIENRLMAHHSRDEHLLELYSRWDCAECKATGTTDQPLHKCPECGAKEGKRDKTKPDQPPISGFCLGRDIHANTSVKLGYFARFGYEVGRERAKTTNHAATYGMSAQTMAIRDDIPVKEAEESLEGWHETYPAVRPLHDRTKVQIRDRGYVVMFDGSMRRFPVAQLMLRSDNFAPWEWEGVVREGVNVLCQGGTGKIVKRAMIKIRKRLRAHPNPLMREVRLINQVHDELVYEAPEEVAQEALEIICYELEHAAKLRVPIIAEGAIGDTWGEAH